MTRRNSNKKDDELKIFNEPYFLLSKRIMSWTGLWPYQSRVERVLKATFLLQ